MAFNDSSLPSWMPRAIAAIGVAAIALCGLLLFDTYWGDPSIYLPYARNIAQGDFFSYNPGSFSSGSTSPLWAVILALPFALGAGVVGAKILSLLVTITAFVVVLAAVRRFNGTTVAGALAALYVVEMMAIYGVLMYESSLVVLAVSASLIVGLDWVEESARNGRPRRRTVVLMMTIWGALPLIRPDAVTLVPMQIAALWWFSGRRTSAGLLSLLTMAFVAALPSAAYFGYSYVTLGAVSVSSKCRAFALHESAQRIGPIAYSMDALQYLGAILYAILPAAVGLDRFGREEGRRWFQGIAVVAMIAYPIMLVFISPVTNDLPRYFLPVAPIIAIAAGKGLSGWERAERPLRWKVTLALLVLLFVVKPLAATLAGAIDQRGRGYTFDEIVEREAVEQVNEIAPKGAVALAYEVQDRFYLRDDIELLSLDGITDGKVAPYLAAGDMSGFLRAYRPAYWIANAAVEYRPYLRGSILKRAHDAFIGDTARREMTIEGITFTAVVRRSRPMPRSFAGWTILFALRYD